MGLWGYARVAAAALLVCASCGTHRPVSLNNASTGVDQILVDFNPVGPASDGNYVVVDAQGRRVRALPALPTDANHAAIAPDLTEALGSTAGGNFPQVPDSLLVKSPGGNERKIWTFSNDIASLTWNDSSTRIAVSLPVRYDRGNQGEASVTPGLWAVNANGGSRRLLARGQTSRVAWNRQGTRLVFLYPSGSVFHSPSAPADDYFSSETGPVIETVSASGGPLTQVAALPKRDAVSSLAWSPDGRSILVTEVLRSGNQSRAELDVYPVAGGSPQVILQASGGSNIPAATYSSRGDRILTNIRGYLESVNTDGSNPVILPSAGLTPVDAIVGWRCSTNTSLL